ncbi:hypothetical protein [Actinoplanes sp. NPDC051411]|jgi:hypothetical protein|uniref:hypothetical protein n=1 Tax=Actinoplanes sp. NPDC051411 TaxID=3155522 RepID=UPI0034128D9E
MLALTALPHPAAVLAERLCRDVDDDGLLPAAIASVPYGTTYLDVGDEHRQRAALCEPYLRVVFPDGIPSRSAATPAQRRLVAAVARHDPAWERDFRALPARDRHGALQDAQAWDGTFLSADRSAWRAVAGLA